MALPQVDLEMTPVDSSNVASVGYDYTTRSIIVQFLNGATYRYPNQPESTFDAFMNAESKGKFVWQRLRNSGESRI